MTGEPAKPLKADTELNGDIPLSEKHQPILMNLLATELNVKGNISERGKELLFAQHTGEVNC